LEAEKFLKESEVILKYESRTSPYGHLAETVRQEGTLTAVHAYINRIFCLA
jgi:hypothetical protein